MQSEQHFIHTIYVLFKKELLTYFNSPIAYIYIAVFLIVGNWLFMKPFFLLGELSMRGYFNLLPWIFLFLTPAITMRLWSEEKKSGTIEFLLTLPVSNWQLVLAKFFGAFVFLALSLALTLSIPLSLSGLGSLDLGPVIGGYLAALGLGAAYLSLGLVMSSLTKNQIIALLASLVACFIFFIIGQDFVIASLPQALASICRFLSLGAHFDNITRGVLDSRDLIYYLSFTYFFLWINVKILEARKWQ